MNAGRRGISQCVASDGGVMRRTTLVEVPAPARRRHVCRGPTHALEQLVEYLGIPGSVGRQLYAAAHALEELDAQFVFERRIW